MFTAAMVDLFGKSIDKTLHESNKIVFNSNLKQELKA